MSVASKKWYVGNVIIDIPVFLGEPHFSMLIGLPDFNGTGQTILKEEYIDDSEILNNKFQEYFAPGAAQGSAGKLLVNEVSALNHMFKDQTVSLLQCTGYDEDKKLFTLRSEVASKHSNGISRFIRTEEIEDDLSLDEISSLAKKRELEFINFIQKLDYKWVGENVRPEPGAL
ncbi:hypothetical protein LJB99_06420, partial [Deltaproteobacteria bacterium OttesenSCG-928-K17]|nr:hypothetical protein [Deltaproteobacteria bacterium OttesenSCG-928-K17]